MRKLALFLAALLYPYYGHAACTVPFAFVNGTVIDASQFNANFTALFNCITGGSVSIIGGTINNTPIGATNPSTGAFTTLGTTGQYTATGLIDVTGVVDASRSALRVRNTTDPRLLNYFGNPLAYTMGNYTQNGFIAGMVNDAPASTSTFPSALTSSGWNYNAGNTVYSNYNQAVLYDAGVGYASENDTIVFKGNPSIGSWPPNTGIGTTDIVAVGHLVNPAQQNLAQANASITCVAGTATVTTLDPHHLPIGLSTGMTLASTTPGGYSGTFTASITGASTFTFPVGCLGTASAAGNYLPQSYNGTIGYWVSGGQGNQMKWVRGIYTNPKCCTDYSLVVDADAVDGPSVPVLIRGKPTSNGLIYQTMGVSVPGNAAFQIQDSGTNVKYAANQAGAITVINGQSTGIFAGSGAPLISASKGSIYLRTDGTTTNDRIYVNTNGSTGWTAIITAS